jgi:hypothetical protein
MMKCIEEIINIFRNRNKHKSILNFDKKTYGEECPICFEFFEELDEDLLLCTLKCGHSYHKKCVNDWLSKDNTCPNCRIQIK